jgi:hypothetical protein
LDVGHTLPLFDLIGKTKVGHRMYAQCKKNPLPMRLDDEFVSITKQLAKTSTVLLFAYAGCSNVPPKVRLVTATDLRNWFSDTDNGRKYMRLLIH